VRSLLPFTLVLVATTLMAAAPAKHHALESADGLTLHNVTAEAATLEGKRGVRLTLAPEAMLQAARPQDLEQLAIVDGLQLANGVIEAEIAGAPAPGAAEGARGFVGIAFRVQSDRRTYDAFYLRPTNGRADDQERRNRSLQYISHPDWPWHRLRKETPGRYESYADLVPGKWTKVKIEVRGERARLYLHGQEQPSVIVNDLKSGAGAVGAVALWVGPGTIAHFRDLVVTVE
jgi:hypothetical protein